MSCDCFSVSVAGELDRLLLFAGRLGSAEGVDPDDGQHAVVLLVLVEHRLVLDAAALVAGLHRAEDAAALGDPLELEEYGFFDQIGELIDDERSLQRILVHREAPLAVDDERRSTGSSMPPTSAAACPSPATSTPAGFDTIMPKALATAVVDRLLRHAHVITTECT